MKLLTLKNLDNEQLKKIAPKAGTSYAYLRQLRSGHRKPSVKKALDIVAAAKIFGIELSILKMLGIKEKKAA